MALLDQFGVPIPAKSRGDLRAPAVSKAMLQVQAGPTLASVRPVVSGSPADGMTPARLGRIHRAAAEGDSLALMELAEDIEERDLHYAAVLGTRKRQIAQLPVNVQAAGDEAVHKRHADLVQAWLDTGDLQAALFDMLDAIGKGYSVHEIDWWVTARSIMPRALTYRTPRWFEVDRADGETVMLREIGANPVPTLVASGIQGVGPLEYPAQVGMVPLAPHKFIVHKHKQKSGILLRAGLARVASWAWMYKAFTQRDWATFVQNYGMPIRVGRYGPESTQEERDVLWSAVANIAGDCAAIIPKSMEIELHKMEGVGASAQLYEHRCNWIDQQMSKLVLGQTATTDAINGGHAVGKTHRLVQEDIERSDALLLSATLTRQLVAPMIAFNDPGFAATEGAAYPKLMIGRPDEMPLEEIVKAIQWLGPQGLTVKAREVRERMGMNEPDADEDVIGGKPPPPPPPAPVVNPAHVVRVAEDARDPGPAGAGEPAVTTHSTSGKPLGLTRLRAAHAATVDPELLDRLTQRLELDAQGAMAGLTDQVRAVIDGATDMADLMQRLDGLKLDPAAFQMAMQRGIAVANLAGQAALLDELRGG